MHYVDIAITILNWVATHIPWDGLIASGLLSALLVGPQKVIKSWFTHNEPVIIGFITVLGPVLMLAWSYLIHQYGTDPSIVALQGLALAFATQPFYFIMVKPLYKKLAAYIAARIAEAANLNLVKSAKEPAGGLPLAVGATPLASSIEVKTFDH